MMMFHTLLAFILIGSCAEGVIKVHFPASQRSNYPRLRLIGTLPNLNEFTLCSWLNLYSSKNASLISYTTSSSGKFSLSVSPKHVQVTIGLEFEKISCDFSKNGSWNHLCLTWFGPTGQLKMFINDRSCDTSYFLTIDIGGLIHGGGTLIIGQYQEDPDLKFDPNQSFEGDIANLRIWDEVLTYSQIVEAGSCKRNIKDGNVISLMKTPMSALDGVIFSETNLCR